MTPLSKSDACQSQSESQPEKPGTLGPPPLETARLLLRAARPADDAALFDYARDPEVARFTTWEPHVCLTDAQQFLARVLDDYRVGKIGYWAIEHQGDQKLIGAVGLAGKLVSAETPPQFIHARAELAYVLARPYWNQGLMTEAAREVLQFGFAQWNLNRIEARCLVENIASARVMEKLGMNFEGTLRQQMHIKGVFRDVKIYAVLKSDWQRLNL
ncbi:MAG TPA: GNAT family protein [Abditibacteriaceae bacterium]|jgi:ribosomal-protein-alanine N-acetyltransferase